MAAPFVTRDLIARPPSNVLRHASFGAAGMAWADLTELTKFKPVQLVAVAEVDLNRTAELKKRFPAPESTRTGASCSTRKASSSIR